MAKYDLSVAIIFKNEIRCLERCLISLQPLKERLSTQLVMADTGSTDGSREVAERYADVLFDFPWINDFAAARNATVERCEGKWTLVIDCDEWLDSDISELERLVHAGNVQRRDGATVIQRNYITKELTYYNDFSAFRLLRMDAEPSYRGAIHEQPVFGAEKKFGTVLSLRRTILHHDGYVMVNDGSDEGKRKLERNIALLRKELQKSPNDLRRLDQFIDSGMMEPDYLEMVRHAVLLVKDDSGENAMFAPAILRNAVMIGIREQLPEVDEWFHMALGKFPDSYFTRVDIPYFMMVRAKRENCYEDVIKFGESYLSAWRKYQRDEHAAIALTCGVLKTGSEANMYDAKLTLANAYQIMGESKLSYSRLKELVWKDLTTAQTQEALRVISTLCLNYDVELELLMRAFWDGICEEYPTKDRADSRKKIFLLSGMALFEINKPDDVSIDTCVRRMFLPLRGKCILGDAAALMHAETFEEADAILANVEDPAQLPDKAFLHALQVGAEFPIPGRELTNDQIAALANKLRVDPPFLREAAKFAASAAQTEQEVLWGYALAKVALEQATASVLPPKEPEDAP